MPAFMDLIGGAGWQLGCLPMLNRLGQSCVPLLFSDHIANLPRKSTWLCVNTLAMGGCFLVLAGAWWGTLGICFALPVIVTSALIGLLIDVLGLRIVFGCVLVMLVFGWVVTLRLEEPRHSN